MPGEGLFAPIFTTDDLLDATSDRAWLQAMLDAEAALAAAEADCGVIPAPAAAAIAAAARAEDFDLDAIGRDARAGGNPAIPLVKALTAAVGPDGRAWVHWGATSQDIIDTAAVLVARRALRFVGADVARLAGACADLADRHRATVMTGRTLLQPALPITFGLKAAGWLTAADTAAAQLRTAGAGLPSQLGGAAGTLASLGAEGPAVAAAFSIRLGLAEPVLPWHTARAPFATLAGALGLAAGTAAKISTDVALLMQQEVAEAFEPSPGGSSTLPHKRNPASAAAVVGAARRAHALVPVLLGGLIGEHERPVGAWHAEWQPLAELLGLAGGAVARTADVVAGLDVRPEAMAANLQQAGPGLVAERLALELAASTGDRAGARRTVTEALEAGGDAAAALLAAPMVAAVWDRATVERLLDPAGYLGATDTWIDRALEAHQRTGAEGTS